MAFNRSKIDRIDRLGEAKSKSTQSTVQTQKATAGGARPYSAGGGAPASAGPLKIWPLLFFCLGHMVCAGLFYSFKSFVQDAQAPPLAFGIGQRGAPTALGRCGHNRLARTSLARGHGPAHQPRKGVVVAMFQTRPPHDTTPVAPRSIERGPGTFPAPLATRPTHCPDPSKAAAGFGRARGEPPWPQRPPPSSRHPYPHTKTTTTTMTPPPALFIRSISKQRHFLGNPPGSHQHQHPTHPNPPQNSTTTNPQLQP